MDDGASYAVVWMYRNCSDGLSHVEGWVEDWACDDQVAELTLWFSDRDTVAEWSPYRTEAVPMSGGCELYTTADFAYSDTDPDPEMLACVRARSASAQSPGECEAF